MKENILDCKEKKVFFQYEGETFSIDLTEGDLEDSWNGITTSKGEIRDFNFSWVEEDENHIPNIWLYVVDEDNRTNHSDYVIINFDIIIGTKEEYFRE